MRPRGYSCTIRPWKSAADRKNASDGPRPRRRVIQGSCGDHQALIAQTEALPERRCLGILYGPVLCSSVLHGPDLSLCIWLPPELCQQILLGLDLSPRILHAPDLSVLSHGPDLWFGISYGLWFGILYRL